MSFAIARTFPTRHALTRTLPWLAAAVSIGVLIFHLATDLPRHQWLTGASEADLTVESTVKAKVEPVATPSGSATTVSLSEIKCKTAGVSTESVRADRLAAEMGVAGRIEVDSDRRVEVRSRAPAVVREVHVVLGQQVKRGQPLATLDSPDVGTARLNLRAKQRELLTARIEADWKTKIADTVAMLAPQIVKGVDPEVLEKEFADKPLGAFRGILLQAYSQFDIAAHEEEKTTKLRGQQIIGEHPAILAKHTRQGLQAGLFSAIEQAKFDAAQQTRLANQAMKLAESAVVDAGQRLRILGVDENIQDLIDHADQVDKVAIDDDVTLYRIVAPFDGTIITKSAVLSQRADPIDLLFTLADLSDVWVTANVPESDLAKLPNIQGGTVRLSATAYAGRIFDAKLLSVGALVDPLTRTVPLLAQADNREGLLRPGMFARILLDSPVSEQVLTVPAASVVEVEGRTSVFQPVGSDAEHPSFGLRPIVTGREVGDRIVVKSGLKEGDVVVAGGAFVLKSELILQSSPDED
ncbi:MAG: efflux RND transporter periplasmic adaptor subunit [Paludisphaera borealis]|uniref:efflux RND transporter periplasmic adaptor subunit n=1 Tax=Paludisphaera borealis TaxID=1387353 RepID=UPI00283C8273|nr:efflux RND transporter periplasmic adaptor subunit [Paludisphaera borealis]MDR3618008.1 efflux RND transporter periplasmic adaptor subunit [Paludisphaera borealis]